MSQRGADDHASGEASGGALRERFYRSVAETLTLLHVAPGRDRRAALREVAQRLADVMALPLVWIGRLEPGVGTVCVVGAAGPARAYGEALKLDIANDLPEGRGPLALTLREGRPRLTPCEAAEFAPWRAAAATHGLSDTLVAAATTTDGGHITLSVYGDRVRAVLTADLLDWAQRLAAELARYWDAQGLFEREQRLRRYRDAQRAIQHALLRQPDPPAIYRSLAEALVEVAGAAAVDVLAADAPGPLLRRVALAGPLSASIRDLPRPPREPDGPMVPTPTLAFSRGLPVIRVQPGDDPTMPQGWRQAPLAAMGAVACWPIFGASDEPPQAAAAATGVFAVVTLEPDAFTAEMRALLDEIAEAAGLALQQHAQRQSLAYERERQAHLALHDALTGLPNRRALEHQLEGALARSRRHRLLVAVGLLDLDDFKPVNDRHGHAGGDQLLKEVAQRLRQGVRADDYVARLGGDEFVLVFEDIERSEDLGLLLDRVQSVLAQPFAIDGEALPLRVSLGVALFPLHAQASGEQLLRRADQAMYQVKLHKHEPHAWWGLPPDGETPVTAPSEREIRELEPYGALAAELLSAGVALSAAQREKLVEDFYAELTGKAEPARLLAALPPEDWAALKRKQLEHVGLLLQPQLDAATHSALARRAGRSHAACGIESVWISDSVESLRETLDTLLARQLRRDRRVLLVMHRRLGLDRQWQLEGMRALQQERDQLLGRISTIAWAATGYLDLIQSVVDALAAHEEITACAIGRPDAGGRFIFEAVAGASFADFLRAVERDEVPPIRAEADRREGGGPSGRAWRNGSIERCSHYATDPAMLTWRAIALRLGIRSSVAIPLTPAPQVPVAVLSIYSRYPGGFVSDSQQAFTAQLKTLLDLALARLAPAGRSGAALPFTVRERWRRLIGTAALEMHYQPVIDLARGQLVELEALARLRDEGELLPPGRFLPALREEDLLLLFRGGLRQALHARRTLAAGGLALGIAVNLPATALHDARYLEVAGAELDAIDVPPSAVCFELLESAAGNDSEPDALLGVAGVMAFKALGVRVVEDDLGAGYSSLSRLRQWPFDRVKIDQTLVREVSDDPLRTLRFMRQLTRLGHDLDIEVVIEGLETPGLVEAAMSLGADFGQGYALARPMPLAAVAAWQAGFRCDGDPERPRTALGALAGFILWEEQLGGLHGDAALQTKAAARSCRVQAYLDQLATLPDTLAQAHRTMHEAARRGVHTPAIARRAMTLSIC
jgi:diguanylate cyclase (GGDEF)-like protein